MKLFSRWSVGSVAVAGVLALPALAWGFANPLPDFESGGTVKAADFNAIFADIYGSLNELDQKTSAVISENTVWTVGDNDDYETLGEALDAASEVRIARGDVSADGLDHGELVRNAPPESRLTRCKCDRIERQV